MLSEINYLIVRLFYDCFCPGFNTLVLYKVLWIPFLFILLILYLRGIYCLTEHRGKRDA